MSFAVIMASPSGLQRRGLLDHAQEVRFFDDDELFAVELDFGAGALAEEHAVADFDIQWMDLTVLRAGARAGRDNLVLDGLLLCRVGNKDATYRFLFRGDAPDHDEILKRTHVIETLLAAICAPDDDRRSAGSGAVKGVYGDNVLPSAFYMGLKLLFTIEAESLDRSKSSPIYYWHNVIRPLDRFAV